MKFKYFFLLVFAGNICCMDMQTFAGAVPAGVAIEFEAVDEEAGIGFDEKTNVVTGLYDYAKSLRVRGGQTNPQQAVLERMADALEKSSGYAARGFEQSEKKDAFQKKLNITGLVTGIVSTSISVVALILAQKQN